MIIISIFMELKFSLNYIMPRSVSLNEEIGALLFRLYHEF